MERIVYRKDLIQTVIDGKICKAICLILVFQHVFKQPCRFIAGIIAQISLPYIIAALVHNDRCSLKSHFLQPLSDFPKIVLQIIHIPADCKIKAVTIDNQVQVFLLFP